MQKKLKQGITMKPDAHCCEQIHYWLSLMHKTTNSNQTPHSVNSCTEATTHCEDELYSYTSTFKRLNEILHKQENETLIRDKFTLTLKNEALTISKDTGKKIELKIIFSRGKVIEILLAPEKTPEALLTAKHLIDDVEVCLKIKTNRPTFPPKPADIIRRLTKNQSQHNLSKPDLATPRPHSHSA